MFIYNIVNAYALFLDSVQLFSKPYLCCMLQDFIKETSFNKSVHESEATDSGLSKKERGYLGELKNALMKLKFFDKNNDLYQFKQVMTSS